MGDVFLNNRKLLRMRADMLSNKLVHIQATSIDFLMGFHHLEQLSHIIFGAMINIAAS